MKITAVRGYPVKVGIRNQFIVTVETDEGVTGVGEGGISGREAAMQGMLEHFSRFLIGEDPRRIEHLWQTMYRGAYFEGGKINAATVSAVDIALWDILGKWLGVPVYQLLGGATRERVQCFATPGVLNGAECVEEARRLADEGWRYMRFIPGMPGPDWDGKSTLSTSPSSRSSWPFTGSARSGASWGRLSSSRSTFTTASQLRKQPSFASESSPCICNSLRNQSGPRAPRPTASCAP